MVAQRFHEFFPGSHKSWGSILQGLTDCIARVDDGVNS